MESSEESVRAAEPSDAARLARSTGGAGSRSRTAWPSEESRSLYRRFGCAPSEEIFELDLTEA